MPLAAAAPAIGQVVVTGISPDSIWGTEIGLLGQGTVLTITGSFPWPFLDGTARLKRPGQPDIAGSDFDWVSPSEVTARFDFTGAASGLWDVYVAAPLHGSGTLPDAFTVKTPLHFKRLGTWGGPVVSMQVVGDLAYLARGSDMVILDISDPANMVELSVTDMDRVDPYYHGVGGSGALVEEVAVQGDYAFVGGWGGGSLAIFDVSDPADPQLVVTGLQTPSYFPETWLDIAFYGNIAYARGWSSDSTLYALDVSDPPGLDPEVDRFSWVLDALDIGGYVKAPLVIVGDYLYVAASSVMVGGWRTTLSIFDLSADPFSPQLVGSTPLYLADDYDAFGLAVDGGFAYVTASYFDTYGYGALVTVDVSDPAAPITTDAFLDLAGAYAVAVSGGVAYVADWEMYAVAAQFRAAKVLAVFDVATSPGHPALVGELLTHGNVWGVAADGTTAYLLDNGEGVIAVDAADPANPARLGAYHSPALMQSLAKEGDLLYVSDFWNGVAALDVSDPRHPATVGVHQTGSAPTGNNGTVAMQNGIAYLAAGYNGVEVIDFADPANPVLIGGYMDPDWTGEFASTRDGLAVQDGVLILKAYGGPGGDTWILDVSDPANPIGAAQIQQSSWDWWAMTDDFLAFGISHFNTPPRTGMLHDLLDPYNPVVGEYPAPAEHQFIGSIPSSFEGNRFCTAADEDPWNYINIYEYALSPTREVTVTQLASRVFFVPGAVALADGVVYATGISDLNFSGPDTPNGLYALDASQPGLPVAGVYTESGVASIRGSMHAEGGYVYVGGVIDNLNCIHYALGPSLAIYQVAVQGDSDGDGDVDLADYAAYQRCFSGPDLEPADPDCLVFDFDEDGDVDLDDLEPLLLAWGQPGIFWASSDQTEFEQYVTAQGLSQTGFEDFEEAVVPGESVSFPPPLDQFTDNGIFSPGDIVAGLTIQPNDLDDAAWWPHPGNHDLRAYAPPCGGATSKGVVGDNGDDSLDLIFDPGVTAVGFDTTTLVTDRVDVQIMIFDTANNLLRTYASTPGSAAGEFFGVYSMKPIGRINIYTYGWSGADNIQMWSTP